MDWENVRDLFPGDVLFDDNDRNSFAIIVATRSRGSKLILSRLGVSWQPTTCVGDYHVAHDIIYRRVKL